MSFNSDLQNIDPSCGEPFPHLSNPHCFLPRPIQRPEETTFCQIPNAVDSQSPIEKEAKQKSLNTNKISNKPTPTFSAPKSKGQSSVPRSEDCQIRKEKRRSLTDTHPSKANSSTQETFGSEIQRHESHNILKESLDHFDVNSLRPKQESAVSEKDFIQNLNFKFSEELVSLIEDFYISKKKLEKALPMGQSMEQILYYYEWCKENKEAYMENPIGSFLSESKISQEANLSILSQNIDIFFSSYRDDQDKASDTGLLQDQCRNFNTENEDFTQANMPSLYSQTNIESIHTLENPWTQTYNDGVTPKDTFKTSDFHQDDIINNEEDQSDPNNLIPEKHDSFLVSFPGAKEEEATPKGYHVNSDFLFTEKTKAQINSKQTYQNEYAKYKRSLDQSTSQTKLGLRFSAYPTENDSTLIEKWDKGPNKKPSLNHDHNLPMSRSPTFSNRITQEPTSSRQMHQEDIWKGKEETNPPYTLDIEEISRLKESKFTAIYPFTSISQVPQTNLTANTSVSTSKCYTSLIYSQMNSNFECCSANQFQKTQQEIAQFNQEIYRSPPLHNFNQNCLSLAELDNSGMRTNALYNENLELNENIFQDFHANFAQILKINTALNPKVTSKSMDVFSPSPSCISSTASLWTKTKIQVGSQEGTNIRNQFIVTLTRAITKIVEGNSDFKELIKKNLCKPNQIAYEDVLKYLEESFNGGSKDQPDKKEMTPQANKQLKEICNGGPKDQPDTKKRCPQAKVKNQFDLYQIIGNEEIQKIDLSELSDENKKKKVKLQKIAWKVFQVFFDNFYEDWVKRKYCSMKKVAKKKAYLDEKGKIQEIFKNPNSEEKKLAKKSPK